MTAYPKLRTIHLLCGTFGMPALLMYAVSAVQMAHPKWFKAKPATNEVGLSVGPGIVDGRSLAMKVMEAKNLHGEITSVQNIPSGFDVRVALPGKVHAIRYDSTTGSVRIRTSVNGFIGMLNRLHHAAGLWHAYTAMKLWAVFCGVVSIATLGLGVTGIWMWWIRKQERKWGLVLISANLAFALTVLLMLRAAGP